VCEDFVFQFEELIHKARTDSYEYLKTTGVLEKMLTTDPGPM
jgi:hypothetical protein